MGLVPEENFLGDAKKCPKTPIPQMKSAVLPWCETQEGAMTEKGKCIWCKCVVAQRVLAEGYVWE